MLMSKMFLPTFKEDPADAETLSHRLMLRAGLIRKVAAGVYSFLPLGYKVIQNIESIIREEMENAGAQELLMPALLPAEPYKETGRFDEYGPEMFRLKDRNGRDFCLGPTHEEIFTQIVNAEIKSYRQLPFNLYQIQTKFRDEKRPRFGLIRCREFIMKDAYSFDKDEEGLDESYKKMHNAYVKIFDRVGIKYKIVQADSGAMGGSNSEEFIALSEIGEAKIVFCDKCGYSANIEKAECVVHDIDNNSEELQIEKIYTPNIKTIKELVNNLESNPKRLVKTILYKTEENIIAALIRGDREVNETKLMNIIGSKELVMCDQGAVEEITGAKVGFAGPIGLNTFVVADNEVVQMKNIIVGANETDYHIKNANVHRDFEPNIIGDIRNIEKGEPCPKCGNNIKMENGIEIGHIFKLGTKYSKAMGCSYIDEKGNENPIIMGSYGIGITRLAAAIVEQNCDEKGIIWPMSISPYLVTIIRTNMSDELQNEIVWSIFYDLNEKGFKVLIDDRDERIGVKFNDADLLGVPIKITVGRRVKEGIVEMKQRQSQIAEELHFSEVSKKITNLFYDLNKFDATIDEALKKMNELFD